MSSTTEISEMDSSFIRENYTPKTSIQGASQPLNSNSADLLGAKYSKAGSGEYASCFASIKEEETVSINMFARSLLKR